jgi:hypothetical protein
MWIKQEIDSQDLEELLWGQAQSNWDKIKEANKEREAMQVLEEITSQDGEPVELMYINDIIAFEPETIYEAIGLTSEGETPKEWTISRAELDELKNRGRIEDDKLEYIENSFCGEYVTLTEQDFKDDDLELSEEEIEELNDVIA